jgi:ABC-type nitrate/sulfonate/bicarbonate transport system permease component
VTDSASPSPPAGTGGAGWRGLTRFRDVALGLTGMVLFLLVWELVPRVGLVSKQYLPPPSQVLSALGDEISGGQLWGVIADTLKAWSIGLAIAFSAALALGMLIGSVAWLRAATNSTIEFLRPIPSVALIPLAALLFGTEIQSSLLLIIYASFWQVLIQVLYGVSDVDPVAHDTAQAYNLGRWGRIRYVVWPTALPYVMTGLRLAAAVGLILAITAELVIGSPGIGHEIAVAQSSGSVALVYALVVVTGLIGVLVNILVRLIERRVLSWHVSTRTVVPV